MSRAVWVCPVAVPVFHRRDKCPRGFSLPEASWFASKPRDHGSLERGFHQLQGRAFQRARYSTDTAGCCGEGLGNCIALCQSVDPCGQSGTSENPQTSGGLLPVRSRGTAGSHFQDLLLNTSVYLSRKWAGKYSL